MPQSGELGGWWLHRAQRTGWVVTGPAQSQSSASCPRVHTTPAWDNSNSSDTTPHQQHCDTTMASVRACLLLVLASLASTIQAVKHNKGKMSVIQPHS